MKRGFLLIATQTLGLLIFPALLFSQDRGSLSERRETVFRAWQQAIEDKQYETARARQSELLGFERQLYRLSRSDESMDEKVYAGSLIYALNGVASDLSRKNRHRESAQLYAEAHEVMRRYLPPGHWQLTDASLNQRKEERKTGLSTRQLANLAQTYDRMQNARPLYARGELREALPLVQSSLRDRVELLGEEFPETAECLAYLGLIHKYSGNHEEAERAYRRALRICDDHLGHHPDTARMCTNLGKLHQETGDFVAAEPLLRRAHAIKKSLKGAYHGESQCPRRVVRCHR